MPKKLFWNDANLKLKTKFEYYISNRPCCIKVLNPSETKNMYKLSLSLKEDIKPIIGFNKSEKEIINNSINSMIRNKKLEWAFIFLDKNFSILFSETDQLFNKLSLAKVNTWEELESATLEINRNYSSLEKKWGTFNNN